MSINEIEKKNKLNSIQLKDWGPLYNFARPSHLLRYRIEKRKGRRKLLSELHYAMNANTRQSTV